MKQLEKESLEHEIILTIVESARSLIGAFNVEKILNKMADSEGILEGRVLLFSFGNEIESQYGSKGAFATMRQMGREVARKLMTKHKVFEWESLFEQGLAAMGFSSWVEYEENRASLFGCTYCGVLEKENLKPIEHSICWFGWGFTEGFMKVLDKDLLGIEWSGRDPESKKCSFDFK